MAVPGPTPALRGKPTLDRMPSPHDPRRLGRRELLGLVGAGATGALLAGCSTGGVGGSRGADQPRQRAYCVARSTLERTDRLAGLPLVYEVSQRRSSFSFEPGFLGQLEGWLDSYSEASGLARPDQVWSYGGWTDGGTSCDSWHNAGRAFDLARLRLAGGDFVSCRYDRWGSETGATLEQARRQYWALAASLHLHFAYVLTYLYNAQHHNHIHLDNGRSGDQLSSFSTRSRVQVQAVQAICTYLWDEPVELTGRWDTATRRASRRVLEQTGVDDDLDSSRDAWSAFLTSSTGRGSA
jgi:hypothetical protein